MTGAITSNSNITLTGSGKYIGDGSSLSNVGVDGIVSTANATAITIDSNEKVAMTGDLQIGTDDVAGNNSGGTALHHELRVIGGTDGGVLSIANGYRSYQTGSGDPLGGLYFTDITGGSWAAIKAKGDGQGGGSVGSPLNSNDYPGRLEFYTTPDGSGTLTERLRITSGGDVGIGTSTPVAKLQVAGGLLGYNIAFAGNPPTAQEKLDFYEEGNFTPTPASGSINAYYGRSGTYVRIGRLVHVTLEIYVSGWSGAASGSDFEITGLPFGAAGFGNSFGLAVGSNFRFSNMNQSDVSDVGDFGAYLPNTGSSVKISISSEGNPGGTANLKNSAWPSNAWGFALGFSYWCQNA
jgi:hypothetical protein